MTDAADLSQFLQRYGRFGIDLGLDRIVALLARLGNPHQVVPIVHVAGTNGKGSTCAYLSSVLAAAGYRVGRYTSPHLVDWTERITLQNQPVAPDRLLQTLQQVESAIDPAQATPTQFELLTAAAWCIFATSNLDIAVIEVGLGGRLDATNVCDRPLVSVITSLSREHWQRLGPTLAHIAAEKAGILKPGRPAVIGPLPPEAETVVRQRIAVLDCPAIWPEPARWLPERPERTEPPYPWAIAAGIAYPLPLLGEVQLVNSALAITTLQVLQQQGWAISEQAIQTGMAEAQWPGRLEWVTWQGMRLLIDGAHNTAAALALRQYIDQIHSGTVHWLMGMLATKDHGDMLKALLRAGDRLTLLPVPGHHSADPVELAALAQSLVSTLGDCTTVSTLAEGLALVQAQSQDLSTLRVLCGSLYLIGELYQQPGFATEPSRFKTPILRHRSG